MSNGTLPSYISMAKPNPAANRAPWYKNTAPTYAGIFLWFVFWSGAPSAGGGAGAGGLLSQGVGFALISLVISALICHFLFYLAMGLMGMKTGLPLYVVGTSTYGTQGGLLMPGLLMGLLQFGWLAVNAFSAPKALAPIWGENQSVTYVVMVIWALGAAFIGLKGIQYVAKVSTYLPIIPVVILLVMFFKTAGGIGSFDAAKFVAAAPKGTPAGLSLIGVLALSITYFVGFFATAGAAGVDFGSNSKDEKDVQMGGLFGVTIAIIFTAGLAMLIIAGSFGLNGKYALDPSVSSEGGFMSALVGSGTAKLFGLLLAVAAFPAACFSSIIAANCIKTTLPKVNPMISVGIGAIVAAILAVTGKAGDLVAVFNIIGASFGPVCGAMTVEYLLSGGKWSGPRKGWNLAGWISWIVGFIVGMLPLIKIKGAPIANIPAAPLIAYVIGAVLYFILAKAGLQPPVVEMPAAKS
jgi:cytosine permease